MVAFALLFIPSFLLVKLLARSIGGKTRKSVLGPVDRVLGGGFGMIKGLLGATLFFLLANLATDMIYGPEAERPEWMTARAPIRCSTPAAWRSSTGSSSAASEAIAPMIRLYDTMAREKREFVPADPQRITMYVCGPTVYGRAHIGNARPAVVFDTLARLLRHIYGADSVVHARNVTDVDDKIIAAAEAEGVAIDGDHRALRAASISTTSRALGVPRPDIAPHATAEIAADDRDDRAADRGAATPMRPKAMCCSTCPAGPITARSVAPRPRTR